jgi:hypothetical protein
MKLVRVLALVAALALSLAAPLGTAYASPSDGGIVGKGNLVKFSPGDGGISGY